MFGLGLKPHAITKQRHQFLGSAQSVYRFQTPHVTANGTEPCNLFSHPPARSPARPPSHPNRYCKTQTFCNIRLHQPQTRGLPTRTPTALRESHRRLHCLLILAEGKGDKTDGLQPVAEANDVCTADVGSGNGGGERDDIPWGERAEALAREAVELSPGDHRPWQALGEACDAQGESESWLVRAEAYHDRGSISD